MKKTSLGIGLIKGYLCYFENTISNGIACNNMEILELTNIDTVCKIQYTDDYVILGQSATSYKGKPMWFAIRGFLPSVQFEILKSDQEFNDIEVYNEIDDSDKDLTIVKERKRTVKKSFDDKYENPNEIKPNGFNKKLHKQRLKQIKSDVEKAKANKLQKEIDHELYNSIVLSETIELRFLKERIPEYFLCEIGYSPTEFSSIVQSGYTNRAFKMKRIIFQAVGYIILTNIITALVIILYYTRFLY